MPWAVVMTASNAERKVLRGLAPHGLMPYMPIFLDSRARPRILFVNYVFVRYSPDTIHFCFSTPGVRRVLMNNDVPSLVSDKAIDSIRSRECDGAVEFEDDPEPEVEEPLTPRFELGQRLRVVQRGAYESKFVIYKGMSAKAREVVLMNMLGREVEIEFSKRADLIAA
jgi:transcription antitermination factor NusG